MEAVAILVPVFTAVLVAILLPLMLSSKQWQAEQARAHARRIAEARLKARLLRLNL